MTRTGAWNDFCWTYSRQTDRRTEQRIFFVVPLSMLQIYLGLCQDVSLRSRPVYLGALSENLHKVLIDLDDNTNRSE